MIRIFLFFLLFWIVWVMWDAFLSEVIPHSRTWFWNYESFRKKIASPQFSKSLPDSADDVEYYWYEGMFVDRAGYYMTLSDADYISTKEELLLSYKDSFDERFSVDFYFDDLGNNRYLEVCQLEENGIVFLDELLPESQNINDFYYLAYDGRNEGSRVTYNAVICNDSSNSIIELYYMRPIID